MTPPKSSSGVQDTGRSCFRESGTSLKLGSHSLSRKSDPAGTPRTAEGGARGGLQHALAAERDVCSRASAPRTHTLVKGFTGRASNGSSWWTREPWSAGGSAGLWRRNSGCSPSAQVAGLLWAPARHWNGTLTQGPFVPATTRAYSPVTGEDESGRGPREEAQGPGPSSGATSTVTAAVFCYVLRGCLAWSSL